MPSSSCSKVHCTTYTLQRVCLDGGIRERSVVLSSWEGQRRKNGERRLAVGGTGQFPYTQSSSEVAIPLLSSRSCWSAPSRSSTEVCEQLHFSQARNELSGEKTSFWLGWRGSRE